MSTPRIPAPAPAPDWNSLWQRASEPLFGLGPDLKILFANRAWEELTGQPAASMVGRTCRSAEAVPARAEGAGAPIDDAEARLLQIAASFQPPPEALAGRPSSCLTMVPRDGGEPLARRLEFWPAHDEQGTLIGLHGLVRPVEGPAGAPSSECDRPHAELLRVRRKLRDLYGIDRLIGFGPAHRQRLEQIRIAAAVRAPVLIVGEPGAGKRQVARMIHQLGPDRDRPILPCDCRALPPDIIERTLFGPAAERGDGAGAASGPASPMPRLALPNGGTLLIEEVADLPRDLQARLVEALDDGARLLATSSIGPDAALRADRLRPDLYFALTTIVVRLAPLRERLEELPVLAQHFLERAAPREGPPKLGFAPEALEALLAHDWPGNLHELARVIDHALARPATDGPLIAVDDLPAPLRGGRGETYLPPPPAAPIKPLDELLAEVERRLIETALRQSRGNKSRAAEILGISRPRLYRRIKELNLPDDGPPEEAEAPSSD